MSEPIADRNGIPVVTNLLRVAGRFTLVKVSTVLDEHVTAQVVYPVPERTTVRTYSREQVAQWSMPNDALMATYDAAYSSHRTADALAKARA